jgi:serine protease Do
MAMLGIVVSAALLAVPPASAQGTLGPSGFDTLTLRGPGSSIGVEIRELETTEAKSAPDGAGALVTTVRRDTPAEKAGFKTGDIIIEFDGEHVRSARQLRRIVEETRSGREVKAVVLRTGSRQVLNVTPEQGSALSSAQPNVQLPPGNFRVQPNAGALTTLRPFLDGRARLGVTVSELTDQLGEYFGAKQGVLVTTVQSDTPAARAGLKAGDVIVDIGSTPVTTPAEVASALSSKASDGSVELHVIRDKKELRLKATVPASTPATPFNFRTGKSL